jgi:hypothetical protein
MTEILTPAAGGGPLLTYGLEVKPDPLQAGSRAEMILVMSNASGDTIACRSIQLSFPVGTDATDLTDGAPVATTPAPDWTVSPDTGSGVVTFTAPGGSAEIGGDGLVFSIVTAANAQPGTATVTLVETASDADDPLLQRSGTFAVDKFPVDFSLSDLTPVPVDKLEFAYGQPAHLNWTAIGAGVTCTLDYQPAEAGTPISIPVPNIPKGGSFQSEALTRSEGVTFTLTAKVHVLGQDDPLVQQSQLTVTVETMSIAVAALPPRVGVNGLVMLQWDAPNADHCLFEDGTVLATSGTRYAVVAASQTYTVTAVGAGGRELVGLAAVTVDPSIQPTSGDWSAYSYTAPAGKAGADGYYWTGWGGDGGPGSDAVSSMTLPPLDETGNATRVIPVTVTGGAGGAGGYGHAAQPGNGGRGGNVSFTATLDPSLGPPAQYVIFLRPGSGGPGGQGGTGTPGITGSPGTSVSATIDGQVLHLP